MIHFVNDLDEEGEREKTQNKQKKEKHEQKPHQTNIKNQVFHTGATTGLN